MRFFTLLENQQEKCFFFFFFFFCYTNDNRTHNLISTRAHIYSINKIKKFLLFISPEQANCAREKETKKRRHDIYCVSRENGREDNARARSLILSLSRALL